jgi:hypothetical protein
MAAHPPVVPPLTIPPICVKVHPVALRVHVVGDVEDGTIATQNITAFPIAVAVYVNVFDVVLPLITDAIFPAVAAVEQNPAPDATCTIAISNPTDM